MKSLLSFSECKPKFNGSWRAFLGAGLWQPPSWWLSFPHVLTWFSMDRHWIMAVSLCWSKRSPTPPANPTDHQMEKPLMYSGRHSPFKIYLQGEVKVNLSKVIYNLNFQRRKSFPEGISLWKNLDVEWDVGLRYSAAQRWMNYSAVNAAIFIAGLGTVCYCRGGMCICPG